MASAMVMDPVFRATVYQMFEQLANVNLGGRFHIPDWHPLRFLHTWNVRILSAIEWVKRWGERAVAVQINAITEAVKVMGGLTVALGVTMHELAKGQGHTAKAKAGHADVGLRLQPLYAKIAAVRAEGIRWRRMYAARLRALNARVNAAAHAIPGTVALPFPRIGALERKARALNRRLTRVEQAALGATAVGAVAIALSRLGVGRIRCNHNRRMFKRNCNMDPDLFEALLGASLLLLSPISLRQLAQELAGPTDEVTRAAGRLVREFHPLSLDLPRRELIPRQL